MTQTTARAFRRRTMVAALTVGLALSGCAARDADSAAQRAQAKVTAKQKAVTQAQADLTAATAAFCGAASAYVTALDRYGDVLNATAPTVGDVRTAGKDLENPREDAMAGAETAVQAQQDLQTAQQELAAAEAELAEVKASTTTGPKPAGGGTTSSPSSTPSSTPTALAPAATVEQVKQAEAEFTSAQGAVTDETPLAQASRQFNAAAVALELAWLRLFSDAGCLQDDQKEAEAAVRAYTTQLQESLAAAGYFEDEVDGVYGPKTVAAVEALQKAHGLPVTGAVDKATAAALQSDLAAKGGAAAQQELASTAAVQQTLKLAGYWDGPVDGVWTPALTDAVKRFQTELGVPATGTVDTATVQALEKAIEKARATASPTSTAPSATSSPTGS